MVKKKILADLKEKLHKLEIRHDLTDDKQEKGEIEIRIDSLSSVIERLEKPERWTESYAGKVKPGGVKNNDRCYRQAATGNEGS